MVDKIKNHIQIFCPLFIKKNSKLERIQRTIMNIVRVTIFKGGIDDSF